MRFLNVNNLFQKFISVGYDHIYLSNFITALHTDSKQARELDRLYNSCKSFYKVQNLFLIETMSYSSTFIFSDLLIAIFFQFKTPLTSDDLSIFWQSCKFPGLVFNYKVIFDKYSLLRLRLIRTMHSLLKCIELGVSFVVHV